MMRQWILSRMVRSSEADAETITALGDKTPAHSFHINTLEILFPEARFIHMLRGGRDVTVSAFHHKERVLRKLKKNDLHAELNNEAPALLNKWAEFTRAVLQAEANGFRRRSGREPGQSSSSSFLRKGQAGSWREELDPSALTQLDSADQALLEELRDSN